MRATDTDPVHGYISPQDTAAAIGVPTLHRNSTQGWSWESLLDAAVALYWARRPVPTVQPVVLDVAS